jgi:hypothetical protein
MDIAAEATEAADEPDIELQVPAAGCSNLAFQIY